MPSFSVVSDPAQLAGVVHAFGCAVICKTARAGYDGKGQWVIRQPGEIAAVESALHAMVPKGARWIVESMVEFQRELSVLVVMFSLVRLTCIIDVVEISLTKVFTAAPTLITGVPEVITSLPLTIVEVLGVVIVVVMTLTYTLSITVFGAVTVVTRGVITVIVVTRLVILVVLPSWLVVLDTTSLDTVLVLIAFSMVTVVVCCPIEDETFFSVNSEPREIFVSMMGSRVLMPFRTVPVLVCAKDDPV